MLWFVNAAVIGVRAKMFGGGADEWVQQKLPDSRVQIARLITDFSKNSTEFR